MRTVSNNHESILVALLTVSLCTLAGCSGDSASPHTQQAMRCGSSVGWAPRVVTTDAEELVVESCVNTECLSMTIPVRTFSADPTLEWDTPPPECALSSQEATYQTEQWLLNSCAWREASEAALGGETEVIVTAGQQTMLGPGGYQLQDGDSAELTVETTEGIPLVHAFVDHIEYAKLSLSNAENNYVPVSDDYICHTASGL